MKVHYIWNALHVLFITGILVNLVKGADLILRPHQQKWLQSKIESLTLWLDYTKPLKWYTNMVHERFYTALISGAAPVLLLAIYLWLGWKDNEFSLWFIVFGIIVILLIIVISIVASRSPKMPETPLETARWYRYFFVAFNWLTSSKTFTQQLIRHLMFVITTVGIALIVFVTFDTGWFLLSVLNILIGTFLYLFAWVFGIPSLIIVLFSLGLLVAEVLLKLLRGITW